MGTDQESSSAPEGLATTPEVGYTGAMWFFSQPRTSKLSEALTRWELRYMRKKERCPDCQVGTLVRGTELLGVTVNVCCTSCHSEFNLTIWNRQGLSYGKRLSDKGPRLLGERAVLYGLSVDG